MSAHSARNRHSLVVFFVLLGLGLATLVGYYQFYVPYLEAQTSSAQRTMILMDTVVDVRVDGRDSEELIEEVFAVMENLEGMLSRFIDGSDVANINERAGQWVKASPITLEVIELGLELGERTGGVFDITVGAVLDLWGFGSGRYHVPSEEEIASALDTVDYTKVEVDRSQSMVRIPEGTVLDLGGIAKGYIIDAGTQVLRDANVERSIVNAGGDISVIGRRPDSLPWRVGVQNPEKPSQIRWILPLDDESVVTSGDYQRYFTHDGVRYHHIIDPRTGLPARELTSVTIVGKDAATCDALSTAVFVLGWKEGRALIESLPDVEAIIVSSTDTWISPALAKVVTE
ncbi:MAG: FAD:protein FMN transferase [Firmicutes bacterium]|nr:FAD:protein FMN transferase [Bacillota bacterium]